MRIQKFLDVSTAYITKQDSEILGGIASDGDKDYKLRKLPPRSALPRVIPHEYGFIVHVDQTLSIYQEHIRGLHAVAMSEQFIQLMHYARARRAWWLHLDADGGKLPGTEAKGFQRFEW